MKQHNALELSAKLSKWDASDSDKEFAADTIRRQHALIVQMRKALASMVAWANDAPGGYPGTEAAQAIAAANKYLGSNHD